MCCLIDRVCNDIVLIVYRLLHRDNLNKCFQEINKLLQWDKNVQVYRSRYYADYRANWRNLSQQNHFANEYIFGIWSYGMPKVPAKLPERYCFSSGLNTLIE